MLFFILNSFAQTPTTTYSKEYYLEKSKNQKKTAKRILFAGLGVAAMGGLIQASHTTDFDFTGTYIAIGGGVLSLASIPCFVNASKYNKMALSVSINNQNFPNTPENNFILKNQPALCLRIDF